MVVVLLKNDNVEQSNQAKKETNSIQQKPTIAVIGEIKQEKYKIKAVNINNLIKIYNRYIFNELKVQEYENTKTNLKK